MGASRENFLNKVSWIDLLKLKASYGAQGNDGIGSYSYVDTYEVVNSAGQPAASFVAKGNPNITWETNYNFNVGADSVSGRDVCRVRSSISRARPKTCSSRVRFRRRWDTIPIPTTSVRCVTAVWKSI